MTTIDYVVMAAFFVGLFGLSAWVSRGEKTAEEFFLAGKRLTWPYIGFALIAVNIGARYVIGFAGVGYRFGVIFGQYEVVSTLNLLVMVFLLLPLYRASGIYTMPQLLRKRFGETTHMIFSVVAILSIFLTVPAGTAILSKTLAQVTGDNMWVFVAIILPTCVALTMWGGLTSVAYTDMMMGVVILAGAGLVSYRALSHEAVGGLTGMVTQIRAIDPELLCAFRIGNPIPWQAVFTGVFIIGLWFWCIDQTKVQILLGARTLNDGRRGAIMLALLKYVAAFLIFIPGLCGRLIYPDLEQADQVYGKLLADLPTGMLGLVVAGLGAAVISTLMALLNAAASMFTNDIVRRLWSDDEFDRRAVHITRMFILAGGVATLIGVAIYARYVSVMQQILKCYGLVAGPTLGVYLLGMCWRRANQLGANTALIAGLAFSFSANFAPRLRDINHHHRAVYAFVLTLIVGAVASLLGKAPADEQLERTTLAWYRKRRPEIEALAATPDDHEGEPLTDPFYLDYRLWSAVALLVLLGVWWVFGLSRVWTEFIPAWFSGA